ncbi:unnamed protein product, partial [Urochloa humidicola]
MLLTLGENQGFLKNAQLTCRTLGRRVCRLKLVNPSVRPRQSFPSPAMESPVFTEELDVSHGSSYGGFITGVRNQLVLHAGATRHLDLVLLRPQEEDSRKAPWFGVTLQHSSGDSVLLRIRADNLYISGYQSPATTGRWWEFRGGSAIGNATQLPFTDNYESMCKASKSALEKAAVEQLAAAGADAGSSQSQQDTARSMMVIAVMVSEAIRFRSVSGALAHIMC